MIQYHHSDVSCGLNNSGDIGLAIVFGHLIYHIRPNSACLFTPGFVSVLVDEWQIVKTMIRCRVIRHLILVYTVSRPVGPIMKTKYVMPTNI